MAGEATNVTAVDNDVLLKAACWELVAEFWPKADRDGVGVLGAAKYVLADRVRKGKISGDRAVVQATIDALMEVATVLEPTEAELTVAVALERAAQDAGLPLDAGESQLVAIVVARSVPEFQTGDKRAIASLEKLLTCVAELSALAGRVRCLEQIVARLLETTKDAASIAARICAEPQVDTTMSICFRCYSPPPAGCRADPEGLANYIEALRARAPTLLVAG